MAEGVLVTSSAAGPGDGQRFGDAILDVVAALIAVPIIVVGYPLYGCWRLVEAVSPTPRSKRDRGHFNWHHPLALPAAIVTGAVYVLLFPVLLLVAAGDLVQALSRRWARRRSVPRTPGR